MTDNSPPNATPLPWPLRQVGRLLAPAVAAGVAVLTTTALPGETRIVLGLDVFLLGFVVLTYVLMSVSTGEKCALMAKQMAIRHTGLIASIVTSLIGVATIAVMLNSQQRHAGWFVRTFHLSGSLLALLLGWIAAQMIFGIRYMQMYYNSLQSSGESARTSPDLTFPGQATPDLWDFMYFSFTIAMCFQTSDVSISGSRMRRLTLMHAIYSFLFVAAIIGFVINVLSALQ
jgi:uncharacterized membrane protein